jgi:DNA replication protein
MTEFKGFPARMQFTPVPNVFYSSLLPQITDITELKVLLYFFKILYPKKGLLRFVSQNEFLCQPGLINSLNEPPEEALRRALEALIEKRAILYLPVKKNETSENLYFLNSEANRMALERIRRGEIELSGLKPELSIIVNPEGPSDIFTLYEQNIGMLTPLIADELRESSKNYPESWIKDAIKEAVSLNRRNWRYIARILEHWSTEGKDDGTYRGNLKKDADPDKYIKGRYGHMVRR